MGSPRIAVGRVTARLSSPCDEVYFEKERRGERRGGSWSPTCPALSGVTSRSASPDPHDPAPSYPRAVLSPGDTFGRYRSTASDAQPILSWK
jgi:hypothetical protein